MHKWEDDGGKNIYDALRDKDQRQRDEFTKAWMYDRDKYKDRDGNLRMLKNSYESAT